MPSLLAALSNALGGSTYPAAAVVLRGLPGPDSVVLRLGLASALFLPWLWDARERLRALPARERARLAAAGLLGYALPLALGTYGQTLSTATSASLLIGMEPVSVVVLSAFFLGERFTGLKAVSLALGLAGAGLIAFRGAGEGPLLDGRLRGDLILAAHGFCWALYTVLGKPLLGRLRPMDYTAATTALAFAGSLAWASAAGLSPGAWAAAPASSWAALAYLAAAGSVLGAALWNAALEGLEASRQANFIFLQPVVGAALSAGLLGEPFGLWSAAGGALILAGMWAATREG